MGISPAEADAVFAALTTRCDERILFAILPNTSRAPFPVQYPVTSIVWMDLPDDERRFIGPLETSEPTTILVTCWYRGLIWAIQVKCDPNLVQVARALVLLRVQYVLDAFDNRNPLPVAGEQPLT